MRTQKRALFCQSMIRTYRAAGLSVAFAAVMLVMPLLFGAPSSQAMAQGADPLAQLLAQREAENQMPPQPEMPTQDVAPNTVQPPISPEPEMGLSEQQMNNPGLMQYRRVDGVDNNIAAEAAMEAERQRAHEKMRENAFERAQEALFPLTPEQISIMLRGFNASRQAGETAARAHPTARVKVEDVSLDPSFAPPVIKMAMGHVTSVTVLDVTGRPWPIQDASWGGQFEVITPEQGGHVIRITPMTVHGIGNLSIRLIGLPTPVTFALQTDTEEVFFRYDARIPEYGPNADIPLIAGDTKLRAGNTTLTAILGGAPPADAVRLNVSGVDGRTSVWRLGGQTYVRTPLTLLSPGWSSSVSSADGMSVYQVGPAPVLLLSDRGNLVRASVGREKVVDDGK